LIAFITHGRRDGSRHVANDERMLSALTIAEQQKFNALLKKRNHRAKVPRFNRACKSEVATFEARGPKASKRQSQGQLQCAASSRINIQAGWRQ
jgi:hypothetical protein